MRKNLGKKLAFAPLPVLIIATYNEDGSANAMNAAWGGVYDYNQVIISLSPHKTTQNLVKRGAFTISFATKKTEQISDYFGVVSGREEDKIKRAGVSISKSEFVDAPIINEYPLTLECKVSSFEDGTLIGEIINVSVDENYLENNIINTEKMEILCYDMQTNTYRVMGDAVGHAFKDGLALKAKK